MHIESIGLSAHAQICDGEPGPAHVLLQAGGGEPLRCCLRDALPGEQLALTSYRPPSPPSPYAEQGAIYVHAATSSCSPPPDTYPHMSSRRSQVLRGYDAAGWIRSTRLVQPGESETAAADLLADPNVEFVDVRNPEYGCFMFRIRR